MLSKDSKRYELLSRGNDITAVDVRPLDGDKNRFGKQTLEQLAAGEIIVKYNDHQQAVAEKDKEIELAAFVIEEIIKRIVARDAAYQQLMAQAVELARLAMSFSIDEYPYMVKQAIAFLDSPEAQAFLKEHP